MYNIIRNIFCKSDVVKLGRWEHRTTKHIKTIKLILSNYDHCGDNICGSPKKLRNEIEKIDKESIAKY